MYLIQIIFYHTDKCSIVDAGAIGWSILRHTSAVHQNNDSWAKTFHRRHSRECCLYPTHGCKCPAFQSQPSFLVTLGLWGEWGEWGGYCTKSRGITIPHWIHTVNFGGPRRADCRCLGSTIRHV